MKALAKENVPQKGASSIAMRGSAKHSIVREISAEKVDLTIREQISKVYLRLKRTPSPDYLLLASPQPAEKLHKPPPQPPMFQPVHEKSATPFLHECCTYQIGQKHVEQVGNMMYKSS